MTSRRTRITPVQSAFAGAALLGGAAILAAATPAAFAAPDQNQHDRFPITVEEIDARRAEVFARTDSNGDGLISAEEFAAAELPKRSRGGQHKRRGGGYRGEPTEEMSAERSEKRAAMEESLFHSLDADGDGVISRDEFSREAMAEARKATRRTQMFERADVDGDGYLSPDEFPPRRMANLDANGDGEITRDERPERAQGRAWGGNAS